MLVRITEQRDGDTYTQINSEERAERFYADEPGMTMEPAGKLTIEESLDYLTRRAEAENYHELPDMYGTLVGIVRRTGGEEVARAVMQEIAERGGLD